MRLARRMLKRIANNWYEVSNEATFSGVRHYGVTARYIKDGLTFSYAETKIGWIPEWMVDEIA